jgi:hypothetical protein
MNRELLQQALSALKSAANNECEWFFYKIAALAIQEELAKPEPIKEISDAIDYLYSTGGSAKDVANKAHLALKKLQMNLRDQTALHLLYKGDYEDLLAKPDVSTKQQNVDTSGQCVHKSDKSIHEPVAYWNTKDGFIRADHAQYVSSWSDYYPEPLYASQPVSADNSAKTVMSTKQQNVDTSGQCTHKSDKSIHEPVDIHCPSCLHSFSIAPVANGEWVGLTDAEIEEIQFSRDTEVQYVMYDEGKYGIDVDIFPEKFARAIEAKLKDKNYD